MSVCVCVGFCLSAFDCLAFFSCLSLCIFLFVSTFFSIFEKGTLRWRMSLFCVSAFVSLTFFSIFENFEMESECGAVLTQLHLQPPFPQCPSFPLS